jgi:hypothetical protein
MHSFRDISKYLLACTSHRPLFVVTADRSSYPIWPIKFTVSLRVRRALSGPY